MLKGRDVAVAGVLVEDGLRPRIRCTGHNPALSVTRLLLGSSLQANPTWTLLLDSFISRFCRCVGLVCMVPVTWWSCSDGRARKSSQFHL